MTKPRALKIFMIVFCLAFSIWKVGAIAHLASYAWLLTHPERSSDDQLFSNRTQEIMRFVSGRGVKTIFITPKIQEDLYESYRMTYKLWPIKNAPTSEYGVILKSDHVPAGFSLFLNGSEVDFVRRSF